MRLGGDGGGGDGGFGLVSDLEFLEFLGGEGGKAQLWVLLFPWFLGLRLRLVHSSDLFGSSAFRSIRHLTNSFQYFSSEASCIQFFREPWWSISTSGTCANRSLRFLTTESLLWWFGRPLSRVLLQLVTVIVQWLTFFFPVRDGGSAFRPYFFLYVRT